VPAGDVVDDPIGGKPIGGVDAMERNRPARGDRLFEARTRRRRDIARGDRGAGVGQRTGVLGAEAARAAGDDGDEAVETEEAVDCGQERRPAKLPPSQSHDGPNRWVARLRGKAESCARRQAFTK
jgi:hypothetical protein